jgi:hypothetical protein
MSFLATGFALAGSDAQPSNIVGEWKIEVTFTNGQTRSLQFQAQPAGKGSFHLVMPDPIRTVQPDMPGAKWIQHDTQTVTFSGPVQFPLGNVAIERGTLVLNGKLGADQSITGEARFFPEDQDPAKPDSKPSKTGTFKAVRLTR